MPGRVFCGTSPALLSHISMSKSQTECTITAAGSSLSSKMVVPVLFPHDAVPQPRVLACVLCVVSIISNHNTPNCPNATKIHNKSQLFTHFHIKWTKILPGMTKHWLLYWILITVYTLAADPSKVAPSTLLSSIILSILVLTQAKELPKSTLSQWHWSPTP